MEINVLGAWLKVAGNLQAFKTVTYVKHAGTQNAGYLLLSDGFESSVTGWIEEKGTPFRLHYYSRSVTVHRTVSVGPLRQVATAHSLVCTAKVPASSGPRRLVSKLKRSLMVLFPAASSGLAVMILHLSSISSNALSSILRYCPSSK